MNEMPDVPNCNTCICYPNMGIEGCMCGKTERALRMWSGGNTKEMTGEQREWCMQEIDSVEGHDRISRAHDTDAELARAVLTVWQDYCRDKGLL
jgi:hypothetical protein